MKSSVYGRMYAQARPLAVLAAKALWQAIREGKLPHPRRAGPCVDCGEAARQYDHRDYRQPLAVEPVCRSCNRKRGPAEPYLDAPSVNGGPQRPYRGAHILRLFTSEAAA